MDKMKYIKLIFVALAMVSCGTFGLYSGDNSKVVASVGQVELRSSALDKIYAGVLSSQDSVKVRQAFINNWVRTEIKRQEAERALQGERAEDVDRMVEEYRTKLLTFKYENDYIDTHLDTTITESQISDYYNNNSDNFRLSGPLVKAYVVRIPAGLRQAKRLEDMFRSDKESLMNDFINICQKNNYQVSDFSGEWTDFAAVLQHIPFSQKNFDEFLKKQKFYDVSDDEWRYMMRIDDYMPSGSLSPKARESTVITKILHNLRRGELLRALEDSLYKSAQSQQLIKIEPDETLIANPKE